MGKIFFIVFLLMAAIMSYMGYGLIQERYSDDGLGSMSALSVIYGKFKDSFKSPPDAESATFENLEFSFDDIGKEDERDADGKPIIKSGTCDDNCEKYENNADDFRHCKKMCSFVPQNNGAVKQHEECENMIGSGMDFCLQNLAVSNKDFEICKEIKDRRIEDGCNDMIIEDLFE